MPVHPEYFNIPDSPGSQDALDEECIERVIRVPDSLSEEERQKANHSLMYSVYARAIASFYRTYYEAYDAITDDEFSDEDIDGVVDSIMMLPGEAPPCNEGSTDQLWW